MHALKLLGIAMLMGAMAACTAADPEADPADDGGIALSGKTALTFSSASESAAFLGSEDDFIRALSPADHQVRFGDVDASYLEVAETAAKDWTDDERALVTESVRLASEGYQARGVTLPFPPTVRLMRTTGAEEGYIGGYTRGDAIVFPDALFEDAPEDLAFFVTHELFHVATRFEPTLRGPIYAIFGFAPCGELRMPPELFAIKLTNPDAHHLQHCVEVNIEGEDLLVMPLLTANAPPAEAPTEAGAQVSQIELRLIAVSPGGEPLRNSDNELRFYDLGDVPGYFEAIGGNTDYIIHPEEIAADNFALLVMGAEDRPNPELFEELRAVLATTP